MPFVTDSDSEDEVLELKQAIIDIFSQIEHDSAGRWIIPTLQGYALPELNKALDNAIRVVVGNR